MKRNEYQATLIDKIRFKKFRNELFPAFVIFYNFLETKSENEKRKNIDDELLMA